MAREAARGFVVAPTGGSFMSVCERPEILNDYRKNSALPPGLGANS
jgi:hypothetical protein